MSEEMASVQPARRRRAREDRVTLYSRWQDRRARLNARRSSVRLTRISPWSATTTALFCSLILAAAIEGLVFIAWHLFDRAGIFDKIVSTLVPDGGDGAAKLENWLSLDQFLLIGAVVACSALVIVPMFVFFYAMTFNLMAKLTGGVRITLTGSK